MEGSGPEWAMWSIAKDEVSVADVSSQTPSRCQIARQSSGSASWPWFMKASRE